MILYFHHFLTDEIFNINYIVVITFLTYLIIVRKLVIFKIKLLARILILITNPEVKICNGENVFITSCKNNIVNNFQYSLAFKGLFPKIEWYGPVPILHTSDKIVENPAFLQPTEGPRDDDTDNRTMHS